MDFRSYFSFEGRLSRGTFLLSYALPFFVIGSLPGLFLPHGVTQVALESAALLLVLPGIGRRLHDIGHSLWVFLAAYLIYPAVLAIQTTGVFGEHRSLVVLLSSLPFLGAIITLLVVRGVPGPNRFGAES